MSPPLASATPDLARPAIKRTNTEGLDPVRVRHLTDAGQWVSNRSSAPMRRRKIRELVIRYLREGRSRGKVVVRV